MVIYSYGYENKHFSPDFEYYTSKTVINPHSFVAILITSIQISRYHWIVSNGLWYIDRWWFWNPSEEILTLPWVKNKLYGLTLYRRRNGPDTLLLCSGERELKVKIMGQKDMVHLVWGRKYKEKQILNFSETMRVVLSFQV